MFHYVSLRSLTFAVSVFLLAACLAAPLQATESIHGAFGVSFGQTFDMTHALSTDTFTGHTVYEFTPRNELPMFDRYYLSITPESKKIYGICGVSTATTVDQAKSNHRTILRHLQNRYGPVESGLLSGLMNVFGLKRIEQGEHKIVISFREDSRKTYVIYYHDRLKKLAKVEEKAQAGR